MRHVSGHEVLIRPAGQEGRRDRFGRPRRGMFAARHTKSCRYRAVRFGVLRL